MKKTYINPEIEVIKIQALQMLAGSPGDAHEEAPDEYGAREEGFIFDDQAFDFGAEESISNFE